MGTELPTARMALAEAHRLLTGGSRDAASAWIDLARELREGSTAPEQPSDRLTLHDVEGIVCGHGRVAIRRRGSLKRSDWWRHADGDATVCDDVQQETEQDRRHRANITWTFVAESADGERAQRLPGPPESRVQPTIDLPDRLLDYRRGQTPAPTPAAVNYASQLAELIDGGRSLPFGFSEANRGALASLVHEILSRSVRDLNEQPPETTRSDLENTAVLSTRVRVSPARPAAVAPPTHGVCVNDGLDIHLIASASGEAPRYAHDVSGQSVCPEQRSPEGHETFVHRFAWPAPQG